ncbi:MAG: homoserine kinase, partial [Actinobacteria bacterium]|nr:homoserine kinase [Actinomycetota bacterium]
GPGFDSLAMALDLRDTVSAQLIDAHGIQVRISGVGATTLPNDGNHLIARVLRTTALEWGMEIDGLILKCNNFIPHGKGLGSSAAAYLAGLLLARDLTQARVTDAEILQRATELEGHPDNVAACLYGGMTIATWNDVRDVKAVSLPVHTDVMAVIGVPAGELSTEQARGLLPEKVSYADAVFNTSRAALLVAALTHSPEALFDATDDRLHQQYRRMAYPKSIELVQLLREAGIGAAISGAGPSVIALTTREKVTIASELITASEFQAQTLKPSRTGALVY